MVSRFNLYILMFMILIPGVMALDCNPNPDNFNVTEEKYLKFSFPEDCDIYSISIVEQNYTYDYDLMYSFNDYQISLTKNAEIIDQENITLNYKIESSEYNIPIKINYIQPDLDKKITNKIEKGLDFVEENMIPFGIVFAVLIILYLVVLIIKFIS